LQEETTGKKGDRKASKWEGAKGKEGNYDAGEFWVTAHSSALMYN